jgi:hypothetical protein
MTPASKAALLYAYTKGYRVLHNGALISPKGRQLKATLSNGYPTFKVGGYRKQRGVLLHMFAAYCWFGDAVFDAECVRHLDDVRSNCVYGNLALGSRKDNAADLSEETRLRVGRNANGARHARTAERRAVRDQQVIRLIAEGKTHREIARIVNVDRTRVGQILRERVPK